MNGNMNKNTEILHDWNYDDSSNQGSRLRPKNRELLEGAGTLTMVLEDGSRGGTPGLSEREGSPAVGSAVAPSVAF